MEDRLRPGVPAAKSCPACCAALCCAVPQQSRQQGRVHGRRGRSSQTQTRAGQQRQSKWGEPLTFGIRRQAIACIQPSRLGLTLALALGARLQQQCACLRYGHALLNAVSSPVPRSKAALAPASLMLLPAWQPDLQVCCDSTALPWHAAAWRPYLLQPSCHASKRVAWVRWQHHAQSLRLRLGRGEADCGKVQSLTAQEQAHATGLCRRCHQMGQRCTAGQHALACPHIAHMHGAGHPPASAAPPP